MKSYYFTFGFAHVHAVNGFTYDKDIVVEIIADHDDHARQIMIRNFGTMWAFQYEEVPNMKYFPRGIKKLNPIR
jgi:hypothetical protein